MVLNGEPPSLIAVSGTKMTKNVPVNATQYCPKAPVNRPPRCGMGRPLAPKLWNGENKRHAITAPPNYQIGSCSNYCIGAKSKKGRARCDPVSFATEGLET